MKQKDYSIGFIKKSAIYICTATALLLSIPSIANDADKPIDITADEFYYDKSRELVYGFGNVEIVQDNQIIVAENIKYETIASKCGKRGAPTRPMRRRARLMRTGSVRSAIRPEVFFPG